MKTKLKPLSSVEVTPPLFPGTPPSQTDARKRLSVSAKTVQHESDPGHHFHQPGPSDIRPTVAASGAMSRVRARQPEFHKKGAGPAGAVPARPVTRKIHGGLVSKRRAGK